MHKVFLIIKREYLVNIKKKSFLVMTLLAPFLMVLFLMVLICIEQVNNIEKRVAIIDESGLFEHELINTKDLRFNFYNSKQSIELKDSLFNSEFIDMLIEVPSPSDALYSNLDNEISIIVKNDIDVETKEYLNESFSSIIEDKRLEALGISSERLEKVKSNFDFNILSLSANQIGDMSELKLSIASGLAYIVFMFIMIYGVRVMRSVIEEKNSRVIEVVISSVKPIQLMVGKIIGNALVALTQFVIWIGLTLSLMKIFEIITGDKNRLIASNSIDDLSKVNEILLTLNIPFIIITFLLFFVLGYLFFSSFFAAIGSAVDNETETQQFTFLAVAPLMVGGYGSFISLISNPDGNVLAVLSMFPMTSPVAMVIRSPYEVPMWQWFLAIILLIIATIFMIFVAAKIYRIGILMYGKKASFKEVYKWLRY